MARATTILALLALHLGSSLAQYCTFYSDNKCTQRVGSVSYKIDNPNCFTVTANYVKCDEPLQVSIYGFPQGEACGNDAQAAALFGFPGTECSNISGLQMQKLQYRLESSGNARRRDTPEQGLIEKRANDVHCTGTVDFYYGGQCVGPIDRVSEQITAPGNKVGEPTTWTSACHNDGLFSNYILTGSSCNFVVFEGENCSGKSHLIFTESLFCQSITEGKYTLRSWQWSCGQDACNGFKST